MHSLVSFSEGGGLRRRISGHEDSLTCAGSYSDQWLMVEVIDVQRFFLCGRLIFGPDVRSLAVTIFLIVAPSVCFCNFVGRHLLHHFNNNGGVAIVAVTAIYTAYVSAQIFWC